MQWIYKKKLKDLKNNFHEQRMWQWRQILNLSNQSQIFTALFLDTQLISLSLFLHRTHP